MRQHNRRNCNLNKHYRDFIESNTNQEQFKTIESEIKNSEASARKILQQRRFKTFNTLKYKPNATNQNLTQKENGIQEKPRDPLYSDILKRKKSNTNLKRKTSESNTPANKPTTVEQLKSLNINSKVKKPIKINFIIEPKSRKIT